MMMEQVERESVGQEAQANDIEFDLIPPPHNNEVISIRVDTKTVPITEVQNIYNTLKTLYPTSPIILMPKQITVEYLNERQILDLQNELQNLLKNIQEDGQN